MKLSLNKQFWNRVEKTNICWLWTGAKRDNNNYGCLVVNGKRILAHRFSWILHNGYIPKKMCVLHKCDNPPCVNPAHLFLGTQSDNMHDMYKKGRGNKYIIEGGEKHPRAILTEKQVLKIRGLYVPYKVSTYKLAEMFNVSRSAIVHITNKRNWKYVTG